jgi:hypothetical protein
MSAPRRHPKHSRAHAAGYTLFAVLLAVAFISGLVATYGRHVVVAGRGGMASPDLLASREACQSGLTFARQSILSGGEELINSIPAGDEVAMLSVEETASGHQLVSVEVAGDDGLGARRTAEIAVQPSPDSQPDGPASLPTLDAATVNALLGDGTVTMHHVTASQRLEGVELTGILVIHPGVELELADVVLHGPIISATVLSQASYGPFDGEAAPRLLVDGNVRIDPLGALPGLAILMPDGTVESSMADARIQVHGDVVAHRVSLLEPGVVAGNVLGVEVSLLDDDQQDTLGADRKPLPWSSALDLGGTSEPVFMAIVPTSTAVDSLSPIITFWQQG